MLNFISPRKNQLNQPITLIDWFLIGLGLIILEQLMGLVLVVSNQREKIEGNYYWLMPLNTIVFVVGSRRRLSERQEEEKYYQAIRESYEKLEIQQGELEQKIVGCSGCKYLYGQIDQDQILVCAIHPQGQVDCPDYNECTSY